MKKCPHCGMNIRDNVEVCGYCGGEIPNRPSHAPGDRTAQAPQQRNIPSKQAQKREPAVPSEEPGEGEGEEEEGGLSAILQSGEKVLIGSLNVSVKKFFFHAYLTNKRIFLIDTQEKKIRVTAKDIPRETIADSGVESSESSDPVLVLSVKSAADDDVKTMKLVFTQDGTDRSGEVDDWIALLHEEPEKKKPSRQAAPPAVEPPAEEPEEYPDREQEAEIPPARPVKQPVRHDELHPTRKPLKEHERQPPVKRLIPMVQEPEPEEEPEPEPRVVPQRRVQVRTVEEQPKRRPMPVAREMPAQVRNEMQPVKKPDIHAAVRTAMKNPVQPIRQTMVHPIRKVPSEPVYRPLSVTERVEEAAPVEAPVSHRRTVPEEPADNPQFCHNCGKRLPAEANFCPGCGTRLNHSRTDPKARMSTTLPRQAPAATQSMPHPHKVPRIEEVTDDDEEEVQQPRRPPVKKTPKGSDMTILQKFLRR